ncbi:alpha/beta hydrolase [Halioglobus maricola]|uniref:Alpha/beta hydrolase n=2 Tax=Halioglobus maricola TaxID=2601894 RepID=A0A5P9NQV8_9GAMM|nr:alpha/beta hydrolase [Halioglobus maricola]
MPKILRFPRVVKLLNYVVERFRQAKVIEGVHLEERTIRSSDGTATLRLVIYRPENVSGELPALLYCHGGGYIMGNPEQSVEMIEKFIKTRPCVVIAPDYRKSFTKPFPAGFDDCYDTLLWARDHAAELGIAATRFIVAGHSAGGGLAAAVTLKARDTQDVDIAFQMPIYPMIDDTQPDDPAREIHTPVWDTRMNKLGWGAYLAGLKRSGEEIPAYAAPARNSDYRGFPPTITFVGTLEPFYWETAAYVDALRSEQVDVAYEEYEGCYHAFDALGGQAEVSRKARAFTYDNFAAFYDKYVVSGADASGVPS